jgi:hypothetical protein
VIIFVRAEVHIFGFFLFLGGLGLDLPGEGWLA